MNEDITGKILKKLKEQQKEEGKLPLLLEFYRKLLQIQSAARKQIKPLAAVLNGEDIQSRLTGGQTLIKFDELNLDMTLLRNLFVEVIAVFAGYEELFGELPGRLKKADAGLLLTGEAVKDWFIGNPLPAALAADISAKLIQTMVQAALYPFLNSHAQALQESMQPPLLEGWRREYCPFCGGGPDMAYLEKEVGARWLVCSRCDSAWPYQRLQCPYCGTQDQRTMAFFMDESGLYRLQVCNDCKSYLKTLDLRKTEGEVLLPLERVLTVEMDRQARKEGYKFPF